MGETDWARAVKGFRKCDDKVPLSEVYRWRWLIRDTPGTYHNSSLQQLANSCLQLKQTVIGYFMRDARNNWTWNVFCVKTGQIGTLPLRLQKKRAIQSLYAS